MSNKNPRQFGTTKIEELIGKGKLIDRYKSFGNYKNQYAFICTINVLRGYCNFYKSKGWTDAEEYKHVSEYIKDYEDIKKLNVGSFALMKSDFEEDSKIDYKKFLASRHSVREFLPKRLSENDFKKAVDIATLSPSACNRQMCKVYYVQNADKAKQVIGIAQGFGGFEKDTINLIVVTFDVNANYFIGERNQGWFNAGLFSMNLVNAMHSLGIGSCFCQFGNTVAEEEKVKSILDIPSSERIAVLISAGYYCNKMLVPFSPRKPLDDYLRIIK
ncbi:nitroreductase family protein [Candidatus Saccharibacteria bacterium]|nr:nitroreductase family protein [Candidatus Saccharibacteria bacterium]